MSSLSHRALFVLCIAALAMPLLADAPATLEACVNNGNGILRLVDASTACHANETRVQWSVTGPAGPQGPAGPAGPPGPAGTDSSGGPPYVWACTPAYYFSGGNTNASLFIFNGSASTANVAVNFLNKDGANLAGVNVPGATPPVVGDPIPTYTGQTGATTVPLPSANTMVVSWVTAQGNPASGGNVPATVRVTSDQPIAVGSNIEFSGFHPVTCGFVHR